MQRKRASDSICDIDLDVQEAHSGSIMIVDDERDIVNVMRQSLQHDGFKVCVFTNASSALEHFNSDSDHQNHHAFISDIRMADMNGFKLAKQVKNSNSEVKVILMSSFDIEDKEDDDDDNNDNTQFLDVSQDVKIDAYSKAIFNVEID